MRKGEAEAGFVDGGPAVVNFVVEYEEAGEVLCPLISALSVP